MKWIPRFSSGAIKQRPPSFNGATTQRNSQFSISCLPTALRLLRVSRTARKEMKSVPHLRKPFIFHYWNIPVEFTWSLLECYTRSAHFLSLSSFRKWISLHKSCSPSEVTRCSKKLFSHARDFMANSPSKGLLWAVSFRLSSSPIFFELLLCLLFIYDAFKSVAKNWCRSSGVGLDVWTFHLIIRQGEEEWSEIILSDVFHNTNNVGKKRPRRSWR
jgi:hypothetical protein